MLAEIWNVVYVPSQVWTKVPAEYEVWHFVPVSSTHALAQTNELCFWPA